MATNMPIPQFPRVTPLKLTIKDTTSRSVVLTPEQTTIKDREMEAVVSSAEFDQFIKMKPNYTELEQAGMKVSLLKQMNAEPELSILALADWIEDYDYYGNEDLVYGLRQLEKWKRMPVERTVSFGPAYNFHPQNTWIWEPVPPLSALAKASHYLPPVCFERMVAEKSWYENKPMPKSEAIMLAALAIGNTRETLHVKPVLQPNLSPRLMLETFGLNQDQMREFFRRFTVNGVGTSSSPLQNPDIDEYEDPPMDEDDPAYGDSSS